MEKTDRELIREALADHPRHIFWDGRRVKGEPLTAKEAMKLQEEYLNQKKGRESNGKVV